MADVFTTAERRRIMQAIGARNTEPERLVRRLADALGLRYRLHDDRLPGSPDLVFPRLKKVVFVHGCFWHRHTCRKGVRRRRSGPNSGEKNSPTTFAAIAASADCCAATAGAC